MIILGIILSVAAIGFFCWLLFNLAVFALPFFAGVSTALRAYQKGRGLARRRHRRSLRRGAHARNRPIPVERGVGAWIAD
ncbi:MAG: hypothetical protein KGQ37_12175 [Hyphomicrobiales bacterium]|nr:hypothetical protein [Hyphomicrobiales bacterium]